MRWKYQYLKTKNDIIWPTKYWVSISVSVSVSVLDFKGLSSEGVVLVSNGQVSLSNGQVLVSVSDDDISVSGSEAETPSLDSSIES